MPAVSGPMPPPPTDRPTADRPTADRPTADRPTGSIATGAAPGKVILLGEHAAVYGRPAIAAALACGLGAAVQADAHGPVLHIPAWGQNVRVRPDGTGGFESLSKAFAAALGLAGLDTPQARSVSVTMDGELPPSVGLGSSAAFSVALLRALGKWRGRPFTQSDVLEGAYELERVFHGSPSGVDHTVATLGGCLRFQRGATPPHTRIVIAAAVPLVIAFAPREAAGRQMVEGLRARRDGQPAIYERLFDTIGELVEAGQVALADGDLVTLGRLFTLNHDLLRACGVSSAANDTLVALARTHGALGAKLTGAGGGGSVIALLPGDPTALLRACEAGGFGAFVTRIDPL